MTQFCMVCNEQVIDIGNCVTDVFAADNQLPSGCTLVDIISEIVDKKIEENVHSKALCTKCYKLCEDYDDYKLNLNKIKIKISEEFVKTSNAIKTQRLTALETAGKAVKWSGTKVVVPASKLQPVPADFQLKFGSFAAVSKVNTLKGNKIPTPQINLKVTIGSSVLTQSLSTSTVKICKPIDAPEKCATDITNNDMTQWILQNDVFDDKNVNNDVTSNNGGWIINDNVMEIDENSSQVSPTTEQDLNDDLKAEASDDLNTYINVKVLRDESSDGESFLHKLKMLENADDDSSQPLLVAGHRVVYSDGELALLMDGDPLAESNDEESQIELQVSGDEETANAIIAAASDRGGAFIKLKNGEMYRVKSVQSKSTENNSFFQMVAREGDSYRCLLCDKMNDTIVSKEYVANAEEMLKHLKSVHDATVYICQICGIIIRRRNEYTAHMASHSKPSARQFPCGECGRAFSSRAALAGHAHHALACRHCGKTFASKYTHQAHLKTHQVRPRPFKCKSCNKSFLSQQNLNQHEKTHLGIKNFVCNICNKAFGTQHNLEVHGVVHSGERAHRCHSCGKTFARKAELVDHIRTHTGERPFACETCGARFAQRSNLHSHRRATHLHDKRHACTMCDKRFKRRRLLEYHIKAMHTGERSYKCDLCDASFVYPEHYKKHIKIHTGERPYFCEICGKSFNSRDNRNTHRFVHSDKKPYECLACGASYMRKRLLIAHMNSTGHLAESIVVNQPRVTRVNDNGVSAIVNLKNEETTAEVPEDKIVETIFRTTGELKMLSEDNVTTKLEEAKLYITAATTDNLKMENVNSDDNFLQAIDASALTGATTQMTDENGAVLRLIQVKLPDGNDGWVALND